MVKTVLVICAVQCTTSLLTVARAEDAQPTPPDTKAVTSPPVKAADLTAPTSLAVAPNPPGQDQLEKFQSIYQEATKVFGGEHTVISPLFILANDLGGRLSATDKRQAGISGLLMVPIFGAGGGHGPDFWPVVTSSDETTIYQTFLDQLDQYQKALTNAGNLPANVKAIQTTKWNYQKLALAKQLFCKEDMDPDLLQVTRDEIDKLCGQEASPPTTPVAGTLSNATSLSAAATVSAATTKLANNQNLVNALSAKITKLAPRRHNLLVGPALGIPITKNPIDVFDYGAAAEIGGDGFRFVLTGGFVGRYQGANLKDVFGAGWYAGIALSGEIGDELFHYFNGGSNLLAQLAQIKTMQTPAASQ